MVVFGVHDCSTPPPPPPSDEHAPSSAKPKNANANLMIDCCFMISPPDRVEWRE
jgi:hypothetical protein